MTQAQIGEYLHISQRSYAYYEAGTRNIPIEVLVDLTNYYNVSIDYILERTDTKEFTR